MILITEEQDLLHAHSGSPGVSKFKPTVLVTGIKYKPVIVDILQSASRYISRSYTMYGIIKTPVLIDNRNYFCCRRRNVIAFMVHRKGELLLPVIERHIRIATDRHINRHTWFNDRKSKDQQWDTIILVIIDLYLVITRQQQ